jgi:hypothetical protein
MKNCPRSPEVKLFTLDLPGSSGRNPLATVTITAQWLAAAEGPGGSGGAAGLTLGSGSEQCAPPLPGRNHWWVESRVLVSRASSPTWEWSGNSRVARYSDGASGPLSALA